MPLLFPNSKTYKSKKLKTYPATEPLINSKTHTLKLHLVHLSTRILVNLDNCKGSAALLQRANKNAEKTLQRHQINFFTPYISVDSVQKHYPKRFGLAVQIASGWYFAR